MKNMEKTKNGKREVYRVMEYLASDCETVQGYACLEPGEYVKWKKHPHHGQVKAFAVVFGMESLAEWGMVSCKRLWDYRAETEILPENIDINEWEEEFTCLPQCDIEEDDEEAYINESLENLEALFGDEGMKRLFGD